MSPSPQLFRTLVLLIALSAVGISHAQFEKSPVLDAQTILRPEILSGKSYRIADAVETVGFLNRYSIEFDFGNLSALGNEQLIQRIAEFEAIGMLREYKQSEEFGKTLEQTLEQTVQRALNLVLKPGKSLANIGSGASKTVIRARETMRRGLKKSGAEKSC
ncbi:hypothetical protein OAK43_02830 [Verrucomicrobiales bacterium]|nr:hypothetical protein [Verrucomicrobiales bacterium]MDB4657679.1 hypothetical protein [Verrucomicrobiales bacterium]MDC0259147.1 hypothetical protein [Verrucomicrobiales bacterium]MDC0275576.1 hypothetical protein [Verrucomicrobiales bacterium]